MIIRRGELFLARLAPKLNGVTRTRPVLVVSNDTANQYSGTVTVLPIAAKNLSTVYPFEVELPPGTGNLSRASKVKADQIRTIDASKILKPLGKLDTQTLSAVDTALKVHLSLE